MLDLTRLARACGFIFLGYFMGWPMIAVLIILAGAFGVTGLDVLATWWIWPVPCVFPVLSMVLAVDFFRRLRGHRMRPAWVGSYRYVAFLLTAGAAFALSRHWVPLLISGLCLLATMLPAKKRAAGPIGSKPAARRG